MSAPRENKEVSRSLSSVRLWPWIILGLVMVVFCAIRLHRANLPLERDEGEYAYAGQLMLEGIPPYKLAYNMKLPGTYACYAAIMAVFGQTAWGIHAGLLVVNTGSILLLFLLARKLFNPTTAVAAAAVYALMSASHTVLGLAAHATQFLVFFALAGIFVLLKAVESQRRSLFFASGVLLGIGFVTKQPGLFFCAFALLWTFFSQKQSTGPNWKLSAMQSGVLATGAALPFLLTCSILYLTGVFDRFWFWTVTYAQSYGNLASWSRGVTWLCAFFRNDTEECWVFWILAALGLVGCLAKQPLDRKIFVTGLSIFSALAVCAGLYFRSHYFVLMLPVVAMLTGAALDNATQFLASTNAPRLRAAPVVLFAGLWGWVFFQHTPEFIRMSDDEANYWIYYGNPFKEAVQVGHYIQEHSDKTNRVAVIGSEPEVYFYSKRHSATGYIYMYPLVEPQPYAPAMQEEMIHEIESAEPKFFVVVGAKSSWAMVPKSADPIPTWSNRYLKQFYHRVLAIPIDETNTTTNNVPNQGGSFVFVFERKPAETSAAVSKAAE